MIKIQNNVIKKQKNFWNNILFHPTDAVEDPWGRRILDRIVEDGAAETVRIYTMFEDIYYLDENGKLVGDYRVSDLRLDYLVEKGYNLILAYGGIPNFLASNLANQTSVSKNKARYKGKMWNTSPPKDMSLWEEMCYEYTKHIVERYGIDRVATWHCQCFNEPDYHSFFMSELPRGSVDERADVIRCEAYCKMYATFEKGVRRVSERILIGGPALADRRPFLGQFLDFVKENHLKLDYIPLHNYGTSPRLLNAGTRMLSVRNNLVKQQSYMDVIREHGFEDVEIIIDEWGGSGAGYFNKDEAPDLMFRETEVFSSYFAKLIYEFINSEYEISKMLICLSGQHEMVEDFTGFRNFFTLNFIAKPIYNAHILGAKMEENLLAVEHDTENLFVIPTKSDKGDYAIMLTYTSENFEEDLPEIEKTVKFEEDITGKKVTIWCIDKEHTNPYRLYQKMGIKTPSEEDLKVLREEGRMKPVKEYVYDGSEEVKLNLTANATYLIQVTEKKEE